MNENEIKEILLNGENVTLECKRAKSDVPKSVWETYSAFANTVGGVILLGIEENRKESDIKKRFQIIGVDDAQKIVNDFWNTINSDKVNENILASSDVETVEIDNVQIVCIHVPQADWRVKPIYLNGNVYKGTYRRNHEGDYHCTERQVRSMIRDSFEDGNDSRLLEHYDMRDIDLDSLHRYRTLFRFRNEGHVWNEVDDISFLRNLGGCTIDRESGKETLTVAGLMMFGTGLAVRERFANFRMDYINMCNLIGDERYSDRLTYDGRWENNLFQFFSIVLPKITFDLPRPFRMVGLQRDDDTPQHKAVREAFTNSIIHCDLMMESGVLRIEKHDDKLVFRNPGLLRLPIKQIFEGGVSYARNPKIQNMLRMVGYGENLGSGFPLILDAWKQAGWNTPVLNNRFELDMVELVLPLSAISEKVQNSKDEIPPSAENDDGEKSREKSRGKSREKIINIIRDNPTVTQLELSNMLQISTKAIEKHIKNLREDGIIRRVGPDKGGHWEVYK